MSLSQTKIEKKIVNYQRGILLQNPSIKIKKINILKSASLPLLREQNEDYKAYTMQLILDYKKQKVDVTDIVFSDGELLSSDFIDISTGKSIKDDIKKNKKIKNKKYSSTQIQSKIKKYQILSLSKNPSITSIKNNITKITPLVDNKDFGDKWQAYTISTSFKHNGKKVALTDIIFSDGDFIVNDFINLNTKKSIKERYGSKITKKSYNKQHLIAGSIKAKHKIVVFSDPLCPFCKTFIPKLIDFARKNEKTVGLYYYAFPLTSIHPNSDTIDKMSLVLKNKYKINTAKIKETIYKSKLDAKMNKKETMQMVNNLFNLKGKNTITQKDFTKEINKQLDDDKSFGRDLLIQGTPTLYTNGTKDTQRTRYLEIIK